jgi:hypothetical protein
MQEMRASLGGLLLMRRIVTAGMFVFTGWASWAEPVPLGDDSLKQALAGKTIQLDTPLGVAIPIVFQPNGLMSGKAGVLTYFLGAESDRGRWWVSDGKLCQKWFKWLDAQPNCMRLAKEGHRLFWRRDDGLSGTATIEASLPPGADRAPQGLGGPVDAPEPRPTPVTTQASVAVTPASAHIPTPSLVPAPKPVFAKAAALVPPARSRPTVHSDDQREGGHERQMLVVTSNVTLAEQDYRWCETSDAVGAASALSDVSPNLAFVARLGYTDAEMPPSASACLTAEPALRHIAKFGIDAR